MIDTERLNKISNKIDKFNSKILQLNLELKNEILSEIWNDKDELTKIVYDLPDGYAKYSVYQRLEELK